MKSNQTIMREGSSRNRTIRSYLLSILLILLISFSIADSRIQDEDEKVIRRSLSHVRTRRLNCEGKNCHTHRRRSEQPSVHHQAKVNRRHRRGCIVKPMKSEMKTNLEEDPMVQQLEDVRVSMSEMQTLVQDATWTKSILNEAGQGFGVPVPNNNSSLGFHLLPTTSSSDDEAVKKGKDDDESLSKKDDSKLNEDQSEKQTQLDDKKKDNDAEKKKKDEEASALEAEDKKKKEDESDKREAEAKEQEKRDKESKEQEKRDKEAQEVEAETEKKQQEAAAAAAKVDAKKEDSKDDQKPKEEAEKDDQASSSTPTLSPQTFQVGNYPPSPSSSSSSSGSSSAKSKASSNASQFSSFEKEKHGSHVGEADSVRWVASHNTVRERYFTSPVEWSDELAAVAQKVTDTCVFEHSHGAYGENIAAGETDLAQVVKDWAFGKDEDSAYDPQNPIYSHFTQLVWKGTTHIGCAYTSCDSIQGVTWSGESKFWACEYNPPGNYAGQFVANVNAAKGGSPLSSSSTYPSASA